MKILKPGIEMRHFCHNDPGVFLSGLNRDLGQIQSERDYRHYTENVVHYDGCLRVSDAPGIGVKLFAEGWERRV